MRAMLTGLILISLTGCTLGTAPGAPQTEASGHALRGTLPGSPSYDVDPGVIRAGVYDGHYRVMLEAFHPDSGRWLMHAFSFYGDMDQLTATEGEFVFSGTELVQGPTELTLRPDMQQEEPAAARVVGCIGPEPYQADYDGGSSDVTVRVLGHDGSHAWLEVETVLAGGVPVQTVFPYEPGEVYPAF